MPAIASEAKAAAAAPALVEHQRDDDWGFESFQSAVAVSAWAASSQTLAVLPEQPEVLVLAASPAQPAANVAADPDSLEKAELDSKLEPLTIVESKQHADEKQSHTLAAEEKRSSASAPVSLAPGGQSEPVAAIPKRVDVAEAPVASMQSAVELEREPSPVAPESVHREDEKVLEPAPLKAADHEPSKHTALPSAAEDGAVLSVVAVMEPAALREGAALTDSTPPAAVEPVHVPAGATLTP